MTAVMWTRDSGLTCAHGDTILTAFADSIMMLPCAPPSPSTRTSTRCSRKEVRRRGEPFKQVLNNAIRAGLRNMKPRDEAFVPLVFDMGKPRVDLDQGCRAGRLAGR